MNVGTQRSSLIVPFLIRCLMLHHTLFQVSAVVSPGNHLRRLQCDALERKLSLLEHGKYYNQGIADDSPLDKELNGLLSKGDTYDASLFSEEHFAFKAAHNEVFTELSFKLATSEYAVFYLDGRDAITTKTLLSSSCFHGKQLITANRHDDTCAAIREVASMYYENGGRDVRVIHDCAIRVLENMDFASPISSFYFDGCGGAVEPLLAMVEAALRNQHKKPPEMAFGFTLTNACPRGSSLMDREQQLICGVRKLGVAAGYRSLHRVADEPSRWGVTKETIPRFKEGCLTTWVVIQ